jgi:aromatic-L-amino-acid decarboxylase
MWAGVEEADSVVWNPHKWLGVGFDFSAYHLRDPELLQRVMSTSPSYLKTGRDGEVRNLRDWGIPLGRRFRALKAWLVLLDEGADGIRARLRRDLDNARWLAGQVEAAPGWRVLAPVVLQTVVLRHEPAGLRHEPDGLNAHTLAWADAVNTSGAALVTPSLLDGVWSVRVSIGAENTERSDVEQLWHLLRHAAEAAEVG